MIENQIEEEEENVAFNEVYVWGGTVLSITNQFRRLKWPAWFMWIFLRKRHLNTLISENMLFQRCDKEYFMRFQAFAIRFRVWTCLWDGQ